MARTWRGKGNLKKKALKTVESQLEEAASQAADVFDSVVQGSDKKDRSGDMRNAPVTYRVYETDQTIQATWGWRLEDHQNNRDRMTQVGKIGDSGGRAALSYFDLQDYGFNHNQAGWIKGMMAHKESRDRFLEVMKSLEG